MYYANNMPKLSIDKIMYFYSFLRNLEILKPYLSEFVCTCSSFCHRVSECIFNKRHISNSAIQILLSSCDIFKRFEQNEAPTLTFMVLSDLVIEFQNKILICCIF